MTKNTAEPQQEAINQIELDESIFSDVSPSSLDLTPRVLSVLDEKLKITRLTKVQADSFKPIIDGRDVMMRADTGSGKTLSYLIPIMQRLTVDFPRETRPITRELGPLVIIISPTRELCLQILTVLDKFKSKMPYITPGALLGGEKLQSEKKRIRKGITVLVATPGRLVYHLQNSQNMTTDNLQFLVLDEADRLLDMGFLGKVTEIIKALPPRQTILVSATLHSQLQTLQEISMNDPVVVGEIKDEDFSVPSTLVQRYVIVGMKWRLAALAALLRRCVSDIPNMKCIVFINCCLAVDFYYTFFSYFKFMTPAEREKKARLSKRQRQSENRFKVPEEFEQLGEQNKSSKEATIKDIHASTDNDEVGATSPYLKCEIFRIHGNVEQIDRAKSISKFTAAESAVLFCTDVAARGLDIPDITTIIQFDPPVDTEDYVHRVGRTARIGKDGISYIFLTKEESGFAKLLKQRNIEIKEYPYGRLVSRAVKAMGGDDEDRCMAALRMETYSTVIDNDLESFAARAWASAIKAYTSHRKEMRNIFNKKYYHIGGLAASFGLEKTPTELKQLIAEERETMMKSKKSDDDEKDKKSLPAFEDRTSEFL